MLAGLNKNTMIFFCIYKWSKGRIEVVEGPDSARGPPIE